MGIFCGRWLKSSPYHLLELSYTAKCAKHMGRQATGHMVPSEGYKGKQIHILLLSHTLMFGLASLFSSAKFQDRPCGCYAIAFAIHFCLGGRGMNAP